jgi:glycosyltransferase involved in cell wall biosynthesis
MKESIQRILLITNIPTPYRIPLFNELNLQLLAEGYALKVVFAALGYSRRKWKINMEECEFNYTVLPSKSIKCRDKEDVIFTYQHLNKLLKDEHPVIIVTNGFSIATTKLWLRNLIKLTPYIIWSEAIKNKYDSVPLHRVLQRKILVKGASGFIAAGTMAKEYFLSLGAEKDKVKIAHSTVDTIFFAQQAEQWRTKENGDKHELLYIGELNIRKRVDLLLPAIKILSESRSDFVLKLIGSGSEKKNLEAQAKQLNIEPFIQFEGLKQKKDLPEYLARSSCFLFPTAHDIWGLVLVEAMASGVPSIASIHAGATRDLIQDGKTGFAMDFSDSHKIADKIQWILEHPEQTKDIGLAAKKIIEEKVNLRVSARVFVEAILTA